MSRIQNEPPVKFVDSFDGPFSLVVPYLLVIQKFMVDHSASFRSDLPAQCVDSHFGGLV